MKLNTLMVRYIVNDVDAAIAFYTRHLGFCVTAQSGPSGIICNSSGVHPKARVGARNRCPTAAALNQVDGTG